MHFAEMKKVTSVEELKTYALSLPNYTSGYAYWFGAGESGIMSGNGAMYNIMTWNNGASMIICTHYESDVIGLLRCKGSTWSYTTH